MANKLSEEKIQKIRSLREKGFALDFIKNTLDVSVSAIKKYTKDIRVKLQVLQLKNENPKDTFPCVTYPFSELSPEDQSKYNK